MSKKVGCVCVCVCVCARAHADTSAQIILGYNAYSLFVRPPRAFMFINQYFHNCNLAVNMI
jgi:hypothetical protein